MELKNKFAIFVFALILLLPAFALAAPCTPNAPSNTLCNGIPTINGTGIQINDVPSFIGAVFVYIATVVGLISMAMIIYSGLRMILSNGDPAAYGKAKAGITYAIIGLATILFAYVIVSAVMQFIGVQNAGDGNDPKGDFFVNPLEIIEIQGSETNLIEYVRSMVSVVLGISGLVAILYLVWSGFRYVMAAGNEEAAKQARAAITSSIIGLTAIVLSYVIITVVVNTLKNG